MSATGVQCSVAPAKSCLLMLACGQCPRQQLSGLPSSIAMDRSTITSHRFASCMRACLQANGMVSSGTSVAERARSHMERGLATSGKPAQLLNILQREQQDWACSSLYQATRPCPSQEGSAQCCSFHHLLVPSSTYERRCPWHNCMLKTCCLHMLLEAVM